MFNFEIPSFPCPISGFGVSSVKVSGLLYPILGFGVFNLKVLGLSCPI